MELTWGANELCDVIRAVADPCSHSGPQAPSSMFGSLLAQCPCCNSNADEASHLLGACTYLLTLRNGNGSADVGLHEESRLWDKFFLQYVR